MTRAAVQEFYDQQWHSPQKAEEANTILLMMDSAIQHSYSLLGDIRGKKLLEIGPGSGQQLLYFAQQGAQITAIDISDESVKSLERLIDHFGLKEVYVQKMNAEQMTFPENIFDIIFINSTLMHVDHNRVIQECSRILKPGGKLIIAEPLRYNPPMMVYRLFSPYRKTNPQYMSISEFTRLKKYFGTFHHQEFYFFALGALPFFRIVKRKERAIKIMKKMERLDSLLARLFPFLTRFFWIGVIEYKKS